MRFTRRDGHAKNKRWAKASVSFSRVRFRPGIEPLEPRLLLDASTSNPTSLAFFGTPTGLVLTGEVLS